MKKTVALLGFALSLLLTINGMAQDDKPKKEKARAEKKEAKADKKIAKEAGDDAAKTTAKAEKKAPKINATTINMCVVGTTNEIPASAILATTTKMANNRYSALRNASAPSYI